MTAIGQSRWFRSANGRNRRDLTVRHGIAKVGNPSRSGRRVRPARPSVTRANPCLSSWLSPMLPSGPLAAAAHPRCSPISSFVSSITGATSPRAICSHLACEAEVRSPVAARARNRQPCSGVAAVYYGQSAGALGTPRLWRGSLGRGKLPIRCPMIGIAVRLSPWLRRRGSRSCDRPMAGARRSCSPARPGERRLHLRLWSTNSPSWLRSVSRWGRRL